MYRLFVAIDLPDDVKNRIADIGRDLPGARPVPREQLHLTIRFIGDVDEETFASAREALAGITGTSFPLTIKGIGHFPPGKFPRVLWAGLEESPPLLKLQQQVELALVEAGIAPDGRRFSPHLTLARLKETPYATVAHLEEQQRDLVAGPFRVEEFHLYSSTLTRTGAIHAKMQTYSLSTPR
jgi:2'-5' RNA ligase